MVIHGHIQKFTSDDLTYFLYNTTKILKNLDSPSATSFWELREMEFLKAIVPN